MTTYKPPTELDRAALRAMGHRIPAGLDDRFREHEGDDYPTTDEDRALRARFWWAYATILVAALSAVFWPY